MDSVTDDHQSQGVQIVDVFAPNWKLIFSGIFIYYIMSRMSLQPWTRKMMRSLGKYNNVFVIVVKVLIPVIYAIYNVYTM